MTGPAVERTAAFATLARLNTLYMIQNAGSGHIGTSFSSLDIVSWLYLEALGEQDIYFSSKGHDVPALYAVLIGLGRLPFEKLHQLRRLDGLPGHPDVGTPHIATNSGSLGMGVSKAKGMALANRLNGKQARIYVLTGDGELQEGQFWESLPSAVNRGLSEITVIVDHNKMQSDTWVRRVSDLGDLEQKFSSFGWHVDRCDGHDPSALSASLEAAREVTDRPQVIIADTVKGKGVSFMESTGMADDITHYPYHSGAPGLGQFSAAADELLGRATQQLGRKPETIRLAPPEPVTPPPTQRLIAAYGKALLSAGQRHDKLVVLDGDLLIDCGLQPFVKAFPERFVECGIAEQDMVSQAGGLALAGHLPVVHSFACFLAPRANEQIYNNATEHTKVIYVGSLAGLVPGGPGHSHQSVRDISALAATPGLLLIEPGCEAEVEMAVRYAVDCAESVYLRLVSIPCPISFDLPEDYQLVTGRGAKLLDGERILIVGYGPVLLEQACLAAQELGASVVDLPWLNHVDREWLAQTISGYDHLVTLDNHFIAGGQGEMLAAAVAELPGHRPRVTRIGLTEIPACGTNPEVMRYHGLDAQGLAERITATCA